MYYISSGVIALGTNDGERLRISSAGITVTGTTESTAYTIGGTTLAEYIADTVGAMVTGNTETRITVTYEDGDNTLDFVVDDMTTSTIATNVTVSANNSNDETIYPTFVDGATGTQGIETDTGLTYNPSSGMFTSLAFSGVRFYSNIAADTSVSGWSGYSWYGTPTAPIFSTASTTLGSDTGMGAFKYDSGGQTYVSIHSDGDISMTFGDATAAAMYQYTSAFYTKSVYPMGGGDPSPYNIGYVNTAGTSGHYVYNNIVGTAFIMTTHEGGTSPALPASGELQSFGAIYTKRSNIYAHSEVWAKDASGNISQLSPHDENGKWIFHTHNEKTGKTLKVHMEKLIRKLNDEFGGGFIEEYTEEL
jgi:hypothetical protein